MTQKNEHFRRLVESVTDFAVISLDTSGCIDSWNRGAERLFGYSEEEVLGQPSAITFTPEDQTQGVPEQEQVGARTMGQSEDERWHMRKDGSRFWGSGVLTPILDDAEALTGYVKVMRDLTERKQHEEELQAAKDALQKANAQLERRVEERTAELRSLHDLRRDLVDRLVNAQEDERRRLSRELHDQMGQQITGVLVGLANARSLATTTDMVASLSRLEAIVKDVAEEIHHVSFALRPTALDDLGLLAALRNYALQWTSWSTIPVDLELSGWQQTESTLGENSRLPRTMETNIYRIVQEALTNIIRHARTATRVSIVVRRAPGEVRVIVEDDGVGFDTAATAHPEGTKRRLGLFGMKERAMLVGGNLVIESEPGSGTSVFLRIPL